MVVPSTKVCVEAPVGASVEITTIDSVCAVPHCPAVGVNVYVVVAVLFNAGDQVPVIPFVEVVGKAAKVAPEQIGFITANVGTILELTVIVNVAVVAHCPAVGVNVYVVVAVLFNAGDQVPVIPFVEVVGKAAKVAPVQIGFTVANVGTILELTVIVNVAVVAH